jgi:enoyl-[acyl-carrier protein] reductase II
MFEGDLTEGELEIGQISAGIKEIKPAAEILDEIYEDFIQTINNLKTINP